MSYNIFVQLFYLTFTACQSSSITCSNTAEINLYNISNSVYLALNSDMRTNLKPSGFSDSTFDYFQI